MALKLCLLPGHDSEIRLAFGLGSCTSALPFIDERLEHAAEWRVVGEQFAESVPVHAQQVRPLNTSSGGHTRLVVH